MTYRVPYTAGQRRIERRGRRRRRRRGLAIAAVGLFVAGVLAAVLTAGHGGLRRAGGVSVEARNPPDRRRSGLQRRRSAAAPAGRTARQAVPILMYHVINAAPAGAPFPGLYVPPAQFAAQMRALAEAGYHAVTLDQIEAGWTRGTPLPHGRPIVVSFDNGYRSQYTQALPVLRRLGWVGVENLQLSGLPPSQGGLGAPQVRGLVAAGWELDTQGFTHADLPTLDPARLRYEVVVARAVIRRRYGVRAEWFCYPSGHYDGAVIAAVKAAGYVGATTVVPGWADRGDDPYRLPRLRVLGGTDPQRLLALVSGTRDNAAPSAASG